MGIKLICENCGNEDELFYDPGRQGVWCPNCGELDQICHRDYDWEEEAEKEE